MYVLTIGRTYPEERTGMMGVFELEQAQALSNNGCKMVYAFCDTRSIKRLRKYGYYKEKSSNVEVYGYHLPIGGFPQKVFSKIKKQYYKKIINKIIEEQGIPDIIHVHFPLLNLTEQIWDLLKSFNRPIIVTEHWSRVQTKDLELFRVNLLKKIVEEAAEFICVGEHLRNSVVELTNTNKQIKIIPNMVSNLFYYEEQKKQNKSSDRFEFITVGRLVDIKRFGLAIEAFSKAFSNSPNVYLTIVGGGPLHNDLKEKIRDLGMESQIIMTGFLSRSETAKKLRQSNVFVSASALETFGVPFIEAMASGKPVIGARGGSIDIYIDESNGVLFEIDSVENLSRIMKLMYRNKEFYNGKQIAERANQLFSENAIAEKLINIFTKYNQ